VAYFLSGVLAHFSTGARTWCKPATISADRSRQTAVWTGRCTLGHFPARRPVHASPESPGCCKPVESPAFVD
jgi:hypothetical protein